MTTDFSVDIANLPTDVYPLEEDEQNVFKLFFYPEYEQRQRMMAQQAPQQIEQNKSDDDKKEEKPVKRSFFKKLLIVLVAVAVLLIHAITPVSSLLRVLTSKPAFSIATVLVYITAVYLIIDRL